MVQLYHNAPDNVASPEGSAGNLLAACSFASLLLLPSKQDRMVFWEHRLRRNLDFAAKPDLQPLPRRELRVLGVIVPRGDDAITYQVLQRFLHTLPCLLGIPVVDREAQFLDEHPDLASDGRATPWVHAHMKGEIAPQAFLPHLMIGVVTEDLLQQPGHLTIGPLQEGIEPASELIPPGHRERGARRFNLSGRFGFALPHKFVLLDRVGNDDQTAISRIQVLFLLLRALFLL